jgi:transposase
VVFWDESGFMLQPVIRRTWAPRGQTPILRPWGRHDRLSVISVLTVAPRRRRLGLYWYIQRDNIRGTDVVSVLRQLCRLVRRPLVLIWDRWSVHRAAVVQRFLVRHARTLTVEWLPAYAPELNPVEQVWNHTKYARLPNMAPDDLDTLDRLVNHALAQTSGQPALLRAFFAKARLKL